MSLSERDRLVIARAEHLARITGDAAVCDYARRADPDLAYVAAFSAAQLLLADLAAIAGQLAAGQLTDADRFLVAEARRIGPALRGRISDAERLAGEIIDRLADLAERLGQDGDAS